MSPSTRTFWGRLPKTFAGLTQLNSLRPIHDNVGLENAQGLLDALAVLDPRTEDQEDYLETLSTLIEKYEAERFAIETKDLEPLGILKFLLEQNDMSASDLGRVLGNRTLGAAIVSGERQLSKKHIRVLAGHFRVSPALFFKY